MSTEEKHEFKFIWKIKHFHRIISSSCFAVIGPVFKVEFFKDVEWNLILIRKPKKLIFSLNRWCFEELSERIPIDYQYELTTYSGDILKTSNILSHIFRERDSKTFDELIELDEKNIRQDVCLLCRMLIPCITPSMKSRPCSVVGWEAETDLVETLYTFYLPLKFSVSNNWTAVERVYVENIPTDITFEYVNEKLQIELFFKIEDKTLHMVHCEMNLKGIELFGVEIFNGHSGASDVITFDRRRRKWQFPSFKYKPKQEDANCFVFTMKVVFKYCQISSISEIKTFFGNSISAKDIVLTQNQNEAHSLVYLQQHLRNMLNETSYSDVKLRAENKVFFAHKCLLAARSPVLQAIIDRNTLKSKTNIIDIHDMDARILKYFLEYLYTGTVQDMDHDIALSLLVVADKYQVSTLSEMCSSFLKSILSFDNVLNVLVIADTVNQEQLRAFAVEYIAENSTQVLSSPNWPQWMKTNSTIASEVLLKLSNKIDSIFKSNKD